MSLPTSPAKLSGIAITPQTSPNKTLGGALGALVLTTTLVSTVGHFVFAGSGVDTPVK